MPLLNPPDTPPTPTAIRPNSFRIGHGPASATQPRAAITDRTAEATGRPVFVRTDAALGALLCAYVPAPAPWGLVDGADNISTSLHKMPGLSLPAAVVLARARFNLLDESGLRTMADGAFAVAEHARVRLAALGLDPELPPQSMTVSFMLPGHRDWSGLCARWDIPTQQRADGTLTHIVTVPHITTPLAGCFIDDIAAVLAGVVQ